MWSKSVEILNPYEATMASIRAQMEAEADRPGLVRIAGAIRARIRKALPGPSGRV